MKQKIVFEIEYDKSIEENASNYFQKAKKAKEKKQRILNAIKETEKKLEKLKKLEKKEKNRKEKKLVLEKKRQRKWFEKFHWFYTSNEFLVIAGRDKHSNEAIIKKYLKEKDLFFHADINGAAHTILKTENRIPDNESKKEAAIFAAVHSKAWQYGYSNINVYSAKPEQIKKAVPSGESIKTGAFMVYGKREWYKNTPLDYAVGAKKEKTGITIIGGPTNAIKKHADIYLIVRQGKKKKSEIAKKIKKDFLNFYKNNQEISLDEIIQVLPANNLETKN